MNITEPRTEKVKKQKASSRLSSNNKTESGDFFSKKGLYSKFNMLIESMRERPVQKNIQQVKKEVAGL